MDVSERFRAWSLKTVFVSTDERHHLHPDAEPDVWRRGVLLGSGGFGEVFEESCVDGPRRHQIRAVKQIRKSPDTLRLVRRELDVLVGFATDDNKHDSRDNFVRFLGWFGDNTHLYIAMELVPFGDLQGHISTKPCSERDTAVIIGQVGRALQYVHERNFVHRDLKPANILVARPRPSWHVKLTDFGISKNNTELQTQVGTEAYMAPELFDRTDPDMNITSAVDVWSLGAVAFCVRTGRAPFANTYELCEYRLGKTKFPTQPLMGSSHAFVDFIFSLMDKSPTDRSTMTKALEHQWVVSNGTVRVKVKTPVSAQPDDEWESQASAMWNTGVQLASMPDDEWGAQTSVMWDTGVPSPPQPNIRLDLSASKNTIRVVPMSSRPLPIRESHSHDRDRNMVPEKLASPRAVIRSPSPWQHRPNSGEISARQDIDSKKPSLKPKQAAVAETPPAPSPEIARRNARSPFENPRPASSPRSPTPSEMPRSSSPPDDSGTIPSPNTMFALRSRITPQWDTPGWLRRGHEVNVKVSDARQCLRDLNNVMAGAGQRVNAMEFGTLHLYQHPWFPGQKHVAQTGYARLAPSTTNYIFEAAGRDYQKIADDLECQVLARAFALEFNAFAFPAPIIDFLLVPYLTMPFMTGSSKDWFLLKEYNYDMSVKKIYNDTHGYASQTQDEWNITAQAFSHFTFERSRGQFLVCDIKGDRGSYTRPAVHTVNSLCRRFPRNRGIEGFMDFFSTHRCNHVCVDLDLTIPETGHRTFHPKFQQNWTPKISISSCRNLLCGRTVVDRKAKQPGILSTPSWCKQCEVQLELSGVKRTCTGPGLRHDFITNDFFYKAQGLPLPTMCREHREHQAAQEAHVNSNPVV